MLRRKCLLLCILFWFLKPELWILIDSLKGFLNFPTSCGFSLSYFLKPWHKLSVIIVIVSHTFASEALYILIRNFPLHFFVVLCSRSIFYVRWVYSHWDLLIYRILLLIKLMEFLVIYWFIKYFLSYYWYWYYISIYLFSLLVLLFFFKRTIFLSDSWFFSRDCFRIYLHSGVLWDWDWWLAFF